MPEIKYKDLLNLKKSLPEYMMLKYESGTDEDVLDSIYIFKLNLFNKKLKIEDFRINLRNNLIKFNGIAQSNKLKKVFNFNYDTLKIRRIQKQIMEIDYKYGIIKNKKFNLFQKYKSEYTFTNDKTNIVDKSFLSRFLIKSEKKSYAYKFVQYLKLDKECNINAKYELRSGLFPLYSNDILIKIDEKNNVYSIKYYDSEYILENLKDIVNKYEIILRNEILKKYNEAFNLKEEIYQDKMLEIIEMSQIS